MRGKRANVEYAAENVSKKRRNNEKKKKNSRTAKRTHGVGTENENQKRRYAVGTRMRAGGTQGLRAFTSSSWRPGTRRRRAYNEFPERIAEGQQQHSTTIFGLRARLYIIGRLTAGNRARRYITHTVVMRAPFLYTMSSRASRPTTDNTMLSHTKNTTFRVSPTTFRLASV